MLFLLNKIVLFDIIWVPLVFFTLIFCMFLFFNKNHFNLLALVEFNKVQNVSKQVFDSFVTSFNYKEWFILNYIFTVFILISLNHWVNWCYQINLVFFIFTFKLLNWYIVGVFTIVSVIFVGCLKFYYYSKLLNFREGLVVLLVTTLTFYYYFLVSNLIAFLFLLEFQSIIIVYLLSLSFNGNVDKNSAQNLVTTNFFTYFNLLIYQFWISFVGSLFLVLGIAVLVKNTLVTDFYNLEILLYFLVNLNSKSLYFSSFIFIILGIFLKIGVFPFFMWKPEIYRHLNLTNLYFYMTIYLFSLISVLFLIITRYLSLLSFIFTPFFYSYLLVVIIVLPIFVFSLFDIRGFLAYISFLHLLMILLMVVVYDTFSLDLGFFYFLTYIYLTFFFFIILFSISDNALWFLSDLQYFSYVPIINTAFMVLFLNYAGLPPMLGFFSKFLLLFTFLHNHNYLVFFTLLILNFTLIFFYLQNYRFIITKRSSDNYIKKNINFLNIATFPCLTVFLFFSVFSLFFWNDFLIFSSISNFVQ